MGNALSGSRPRPAVRLVPTKRIVRREPCAVVGAGEGLDSVRAAAGADELCFLDITASHENRDTIFHIVERTAERCFMPLTVGGGVRTTEDIRKLLHAGADKVSINTAAVHRRRFVAEGADKFGAQCIVVAIDAKRVSRPGEPARWEYTKA